MEIIVPRAVTLAYTGSSPTYLYAAWATSTAYAVNAVVRYQVGGIYYDYRCKYAHTSATWSNPGSYSYYWTKISVSATTGGYTYTTNVRLSNSPTWTSGAAAALNASYFDTANNHDYVAAVAVTAGENTIRPSEAVRSATEVIAARWVDLGVSNAWAAMDYLSNSYLEGRDSSSNILDPVFTVKIDTTVSAIDRLFFAGCSNVKTITCKVYLSGSLSQTITKSLIITGSAYGLNYRYANIPITTVAQGATLTVEVTLTRDVSTIAPLLAIVGAGRAFGVGDTEWGVSPSILSFSRRERDPNFGTVTFVKRGFAKSLRATCYVDTSLRLGDEVQQILQQGDGMTLFYDFNNDGADYERLRIFGFYTKFDMQILAASYEMLTLDVEGLVE